MIGFFFHLLLFPVSCNSFCTYLFSTCLFDVSQAIIFVVFFFNKISTINKKKKKKMEKLDSSLKSGFFIGYVLSSVSIITVFMSCCVPWASLNKRKRNKIMMNTPMMTSFDGKAREEDKRSQRAGIPIRLSFHHFFFLSF